MPLPTVLTQHIARRPQRIALLQHIAEQGSITRAAKAAGISYKAAWDAIDELNNLASHWSSAARVGVVAVARVCRGRANACCACIKGCRFCKRKSLRQPKSPATSTCSVA
jgi:hypothetical protein